MLDTSIVNVSPFFLVCILTRTNIEETSTLTGLANCLRFKINNQTNKNKQQQQQKREEDKTSILLFYTALFLQYYSYNFSFSFIWLMLAPHKTVLKFLLQRSSNAQKWTAETSTVGALWYDFRIYSVFIVELNSFLWSGVWNCTADSRAIISCLVTIWADDTAEHVTVQCAYAPVEVVCTCYLNV